MSNLTDEQIKSIRETIILTGEKLTDYFKELPDDAAFIFIAAYNESDSAIGHSLGAKGSQNMIFNCLKRAYDRSEPIRDMMQLIVKSDID